MNAPDADYHLRAGHFTMPLGGTVQQQSTEPVRTEAETILYHLSIGSISIDEDGRVWKHGKVVDGVVHAYPEPRRIDSENQYGYFAVKLTAGKHKRVSTSAHRIQWIKHHGSIPVDQEVNHKDLDKSHNKIGNLELTTHQQNIAHARGLNDWGCKLIGEKNPIAKLTWEKVRELRARFAAGGVSKAQLGRDYGVAAANVSQILKGIWWKPANDPANKASA